MASPCREEFLKAAQAEIDVLVDRGTWHKDLKSNAMQSWTSIYCLSIHSILLIPYPKLQVKNQTNGYHVIPRREDPPQVLDRSGSGQGGQSPETKVETVT